MDPGFPISYEALATGTPVYSSDERQIGTVAHVLAAPEEDVFDGVVIAERHGALDHEHRFADADDIDRIYEHAVILKLDAGAAEQLPRPSANPAVMHDDPADTGRATMHDKLSRAWDYLSGNY